MTTANMEVVEDTNNADIHEQQQQQQQQEQQHYNFRWADYPHSVVSTFQKLKDEEDFVDVTLACSSRQFTAHKVVLSACSPYFRKLLKSNPCQHPIVILRDILEEDLQSVLKFMYNGEVQVPEERLKDFLKTAETLQVRGLADKESSMTTTTSLRGSSDELPQRKTSSPITSTPADQDSQIGNSRSISASPSYFGPSSAKRHRINGPDTRPESPNSRGSPIPNRWGNSTDMLRRRSGSELEQKADTLLSQALEKHQQQQQPPTSSMLRASLAAAAAVSSATQDSNSNHVGDDSGASDSASDRPDSLLDKSEHDHPQSPSVTAASHLMAGSLFPPGLEALYRQAGFPSAAFLGLASGTTSASATSATAASSSSSISGLTTSVPQVGLQSHAGNPNSKLDMLRVRATDPRPCPKCGKIYRSAHTLRTHMEDKHTICPGYRCVLCGTVAKSRNSLHSHMSRQHRGISTKDLPVVPMPAPFDAELASRLLAKAGVKVSPNELAARASPTAPRRTDLPKLDSNLLAMQHQQFPLPASMHHHRGAGSGGSNEHEEEMRIGNSSVPTSRPLNPKDFAAFLGGGAAAAAAAAAAVSSAGSSGGMGSALLDTYLSMIAAAGGGGGHVPDGGHDANPMLSFQNNAARFAAAAAAASGQPDLGHGDYDRAPTNGENNNKEPLAEDDDGRAGELGSDAENDDEDMDEESNGQRKFRTYEDRERSQSPALNLAGGSNEGNEAATTAAN